MAIVLQRTHRSCVPTEVVSVRPWCHSVTRKVRYVSSRDARKCRVGGRPSLSKATASITCVPTEVVSVRPWCHSITRKVRYVPSRDARKCLVGGRPSLSKATASITCVPTTVIRRLVLQRTHRSCVPTESRLGASLQKAVWVRPYKSRPGASPRRPAVGCCLEKIQRWFVTII